MSVQPDIPISPPGAMSQRTDLGPSQAMQQLPNAAYGEQKDFQQIQGGAPMATGPSVPAPPALTDPTQRPNEPLTSGAPVGAGPNALMDPKAQAIKDDTLMLREKYMPQLKQLAQLPDAPKLFKMYVQYLDGAR